MADQYIDVVYSVSQMEKNNNRKYEHLEHSTMVEAGGSDDKETLFKTPTKRPKLGSLGAPTKKSLKPEPEPEPTFVTPARRQPTKQKCPSIKEERKKRLRDRNRRVNRRLNL